MNWYRVSLVTLCVLFGASGFVFSQDEWDDTLEHISSETDELVSENEKLNAEYEFLQKKAAGLKEELQKSRKEVKKLEKTNRIDDVSSESMAEMKKLQSEIDAVAAENKELQEQLDTAKEKNRLWRIKASQLENEKRDKNLDANYEKAVKDQEVVDDLSDLKEQLNDSIRRERELTESLEKMNAQKTKLPTQTNALKKKNKELEGRAQQLKKQIVLQEKKNTKSQQITAKKSSAAVGVSPDLLKKKKELEMEVAKLTAQLDGVNATVNQSKDVLGKKREMMDQIMSLDAENQRLRAEIDELLKK